MTWRKRTRSGPECEGLVIPAWVMGLRVAPSEKLILGDLIRRLARPDGTGWPCRPALAAGLAMPARTYAVALNRLAQRGLVRLRQNAKGSVTAVEVVAPKRQRPVRTPPPKEGVAG